MNTDGAVSANPYTSASHICISAEHCYELNPLRSSGNNTLFPFCFDLKFWVYPLWLCLIMFLAHLFPPATTLWGIHSLLWSQPLNSRTFHATKRLAEELTDSGLLHFSSETAPNTGIVCSAKPTSMLSQSLSWHIIAAILGGVAQPRLENHPMMVEWWSDANRSWGAQDSYHGKLCSNDARSISA